MLKCVIAKISLYISTIEFTVLDMFMDYMSVRLEPEYCRVHDELC